jgi:hypothetical protein
VELAGLKSERNQTMTDTIDDVAAKAAGQEPVEPVLDEEGVAEQLVAQAREKGIELVGPNGLLSQLTKRVLETALAVRVRGHFPNEQAALKCLYLTTRSLDPTGKGKAR